MNHLRHFFLYTLLALAGILLQAQPGTIDPSFNASDLGFVSGREANRAVNLAGIHRTCGDNSLIPAGITTDMADAARIQNSTVGAHEVLVGAASCPVAGLATWTGAADTDWNNPGNWDTYCVPVADNNVRIPDVTNDPVIQAGTAAVAKSVYVQAGGALTIQAMGSLTINGFFDYFGITSGFHNEGTVSNNGQLVLGDMSSVGVYGIYNIATFNNNPGGEISIDGASIVGLSNQGTFTNTAKLTIGANYSVGEYGLYNNAAFTNNSGGEISIDQAFTTGLMNWDPGIFTNAAKITIGATGNVGFYGIWNLSTFNNNSGGDICIDRASFGGIGNQATFSNATFSNAAKITLGATENVGVHGIFNEATFNNNPGGEISIDRTSDSGLHNLSGGTFTNAAKITIGAIANPGLDGLNNQATFTNNPGGDIIIDQSSGVGLVNRWGTFTNAAKITIGANHSVGSYGITNQGAFANNLGGEISIDRADGGGLLNALGTFTNAAKIAIGAVANVGSRGIQNFGIFNNDPGGEISIDRATYNAVWNVATFTNAAKLTIGANHSGGEYGLWNQAGTFNNNPGGEISIDRASIVSLFISWGTFTNAAKITIGAIGNVGHGLYNQAIFNNTSGGEISIDRASESGLYNLSGSTFTNAAKITIGAVANVDAYGIFNQAIFNNTSGGEISIDRTAIYGLWNQSGTFTNAAKITIGAVANVGSYGLLNEATFNNSTCAEVYLYAPLSNSNAFSNSGLMLVSTTGTHSNTALTNDGIIAYPLGNPIPNVTNNEIIIAPTAFDDCESVSPAFDLGSPVDLTITSIFSDADATMPAGSYHVATNTFTANPILSEGVHNLFVKIQDGSGGCTRILPWQLTTTDCCDAPEALCKPATIFLNAAGQATLAVADVDNGSTADCGLQSITLSAGQFDCSQAGPQTVTLTITDINNASSQCMTTVTVVDNAPPTLSCNNISITFNGEPFIAIHPAALVSASDNCGIQVIALSPNAISAEQVGQTVPVTVTATDGSNNPTTCTAFVTVGGLPAGWNQPSGGIGCTGCTSEFNFSPGTGVWTGTSRGAYYASPYTSDALAFAQRTLCGNGSITAQVTGITGMALGWAGIVMRESNDPGAKKAQLMTNLSSFSRREFRTATNGQAFPQQFASLNRYWLRIVRTGNQFAMYVSPNGTTWYFAGTQNIVMGSCIVMGLVATNYTSNSTVTATFAGVSFTGSNSTLGTGGGIGQRAEILEQPYSFEVYPNPTGGGLNLDLTQYMGRSVRIELYSVEGKLLNFSRIDEVENPTAPVDLSEYRSGVYFVTLKCQGLPDITRKVVLRQ